ncbi:hypothetical protein [Paenibacillus eucommiae]|uniref:Unusual protein kinase regulating ubiquinone biosynthesis (AarF/ABC1/UbiB family) n=1 Tax=Paenibacillus eucommiae TaxID=1355755 RepID=A0ABS4IVC0_9BACL|nr:hypothetical protein [Paenibacillus eucommiae]MBP1991519.1 putative unusual protein kinase regulating ubiquinone biosynthesis (AarF/ABC1/UbiB family) [Paenibacillus eucommiae]
MQCKSFYPNVAGAFRSLITLEGTMAQLNPLFSLMDESRRFAQEHTAEFLPVSDYTDLRKTATIELLSSSLFAGCRGDSTISGRCWRRARCPLR